MRVVRDLSVVAVTLGVIVAACGPRTKKGAAVPSGGQTVAATGTGTGTGAAAATATGTAAGTGTGTGDSEPPVLGPAWTPKGLTWPPGLPPIAIPSGFPTVIAPWPSVFPFPFPTTAPTSTPTSKPPSPPPPPIANDGSPTSALEDAVLAETNVRRAAGANCGGKSFGPAKPLAFHPALRASARGHSIDMATKGYFDHIGLDGSTPTDRMKAAGYDTKSGYTGENIAAGNATAKATVQQWMDSPGHCENIMDPHYTLLGVGYAFNESNKYHHFWTQNFAGP